MGHLDRAKQALGVGETAPPAPAPEYDRNERTELSPRAAPARPLPKCRPELYECGEDPFPDEG